MKRRHLLLFAASGVMIAVAALGFQKKADKLLLLEWASKAHNEHPPVAVLIELGLKDETPTSWSSRAAVSGAKVVHREGYRFRDKDKLIDPDRWEASSHRPLRLPPRRPDLAKVEPVASVGVVLHLTDVKSDATLTIEPRPESKDKPASVALKDVLAGKTVALWDGTAAVRLVTTATPVATTKTEDDFPAACYGPDGTLWVAYISYTVKEEHRRIEPPQLKEQPKDFKAYSTPEFGDQLWVKYYREGKWSESIAVTEPRQDLVRCAIAAEGDGTVWVAYSAHRADSHDIYVRPISKKYGKEETPAPGPEQKLATDYPGRQLAPVACTANDGGVLVVSQAWTWSDRKEEGWGSQLQSFWCTSGKWKAGNAPGLPMTNWYPALSPGRGAGDPVIAFDTYSHGDYNVAFFPGGDFHPIAFSPRYEARPSITCDPKGQLWIAYEEGPEQWGKDFGALDDKDGNPLYFARTVKVVCLQDGKLMRPVAELPPLAQRGESPDTGQKVEALPRYAYPKVGIDGKGRVWLTYRQKFGSRYTSHPGSYWLTMARRLDGDKWTEPIEVHHSDGLLDDRPVLLPHPAGGLRIIHNTDGRFATPEVIDNQVYISYIDLPGDPVEPKLVQHDPGKKVDELVKRAQRAQQEREVVQRIRDYRVEAGGKKYRLLRGEFHRHTEISWDGGPDGSLEDMFRYGIDAAGMDWIGNGDHDNGGGREYSWWLTQKLTDAYHVKERFTPMFTYERSVSYPHGHRNCMFVQRGVRTLERLAAPPGEKVEGGVHPDDTKMLYRYLREMNGICAVHTSATSMGTDWRDNDPVVEPIVEIYQGDRMSYEKQGAPRAGYEATSGKKPVNIAGWFPKGFIDNALKEKKYRLGFQSSSDHFSTHISYCVVLAERFDRAGILDAVKKRHCYGATDDIIVDVRSGPHVMGDEFQTNQPPTLQINVIGTAPLARIDILRDSEVVESIKPGKREHRGTWTDPQPETGTHYYYIRVVQTDDEIAWASPLWIEYKK